MNGQEKEPGLKAAKVRLMLLAVAVVGLAVAAFFWKDLALSVFDQLEATPTAIIIFVAAYAAFTIGMVPGSIGTVASGALFGLWFGFAAAFTGAVLGAIAAFLIARKLGRESAEKLARGRLATLDEFLEDNQFFAFLTFRLLPIFPFNAFNYGAGLTAVSTRTYILTTMIGIAPGTFVLVAVGGTAKDPTGLPFILTVTAFACLTAIGGVFAKRAKEARR